MNPPPQKKGNIHDEGGWPTVTGPAPALTKLPGATRPTLSASHKTRLTTTGPTQALIKPTRATKLSLLASQNAGAASVTLAEFFLHQRQMLVIKPVKPA